MLITPFLHVRPEIHRKPHTKVGSLSLANCLVALNREPSNSDCNVLTHLVTLLVFLKRPRCMMVLMTMMFFVKIRKQMTSALWIPAKSKTRLICFSLVIPLQRNHLFDLQCKWNSWFLCNGNFGLKRVKIFHFCSYTLSPLISAEP